VSKDRVAFNPDQALQHINQTSAVCVNFVDRDIKSFPSEIGKYRCQCSQDDFDQLDYSYTFTADRKETIVYPKVVLKQSEVIVQPSPINAHALENIDLNHKLIKKVLAEFKVALVPQDIEKDHWTYTTDEDYIDKVLEVPIEIVIDGLELRIDRKNPNETVVNASSEVNNPPGMMWTFILKPTNNSSSANSTVCERLSIEDADKLKVVIYKESGVIIDIEAVHEQHISCTCPLAESQQLALSYEHNKLSFVVVGESICLKFSRDDRQPVESVDPMLVRTLLSLNYTISVQPIISKCKVGDATWSYICSADNRDRLLSLPCPLVVDNGFEKLTCSSGA
jgi:hypothetical protein